MDIREQNLTEKELIKKIREIDEMKSELHELLEKLVIQTGLGENSNDWCEDINFPLGDINIFSCGYYCQLTISTDEDEVEIDYDYDLMKEILAEVKKRVKEYNKLLKGNKKIAKKVFEKPFNNYNLDKQGEI